VVDLGQVVLAEGQVQGADAFGQVGRGASADDGDLDGWLGQHPGHRELGDGGAAVGGEGAQCRDDLQVAAEPGPGEGRAVRPPVARVERGGPVDGAAEQSMGQRPVGQHPDVMRGGVAPNFTVCIPSSYRLA